jgi:hypothetical protein
MFFKLGTSLAAIAASVMMFTSTSYAGALDANIQQASGQMGRFHVTGGSMMVPGAHGRSCVFLATKIGLLEPGAVIAGGVDCRTGKVGTISVAATEPLLNVAVGGLLGIAGAKVGKTSIGDVTAVSSSVINNIYRN